MTYIDFFLLLTEHWVLFVLSMAVGMTAFMLIAFRITSSWLSPLRYQTVICGIGFSIVLFLLFTQSISRENATYTILSFVLFWTVLLSLYKNKQRKVSIRIISDSYYSSSLFWHLYLLNILLTLVSYSKFGLPILNENSRLAVYVDSGGWGVIYRLQQFMTIYIYFYLFCLYLDKKKTVGYIIKLMILPIVFGILSGSRSSFLGVIFCLWGARTYYCGLKTQLYPFRKLLVALIAISIFSFSLKADNLSIATLSFLQRIVSSGDTYWMALYQSNWDDVVVSNPLKYLTIGFLGPLRLLDTSSTETPIGFQLYQLVYPEMDNMVGPIGYFPVLSYVLFGRFGGLLYSGILGAISATAISFSFIRSNSIIISSVYYYAFLTSMSLLSDTSVAISRLFDFVLNITVVFGILILISFYKLLRSYGKSISVG